MNHVEIFAEMWAKYEVDKHIIIEQMCSLNKKNISFTPFCEPFQSMMGGGSVFWGSWGYASCMFPESGAKSHTGGGWSPKAVQVGLPIRAFER